MNDMAREAVRTTAVKLLRSDDLDLGEKDGAVGILRANLGIGYPHAVRCDWCHEYRTLFRDERTRSSNAFSAVSPEMSAPITPG